MLKVVEDANVHIVCRAIECEQLAESMVVVVFVGELENGLACLLAEPHDCAANELVGPLTRGHLPWVADAGESLGSGQVDVHAHVAVHLEERSRCLVVDFSLHSVKHQR